MGDVRVFLNEWCVFTCKTEGARMNMRTQCLNLINHNFVVGIFHNIHVYYLFRIFQ